MDSFNKIIQDIKDIKIQGATNIALAGLKAMNLKRDYTSLRKLINSRPTEPCLQNAIKFAKETSPSLAKKVLLNINSKTEKIASTLIKPNSIIFTHCHSSTVINALKIAKQTKKFSVHNTESRPLYQGRKTAEDLAKLKIKVTHFVDSAAEEAIKESDIILLGADLITKNADVYNKMGSFLISELAKKHKTKLYILTNSWKYTTKDLKIEERDSKEVWDIENPYIKIRNPAFEKIPRKNIKAIVSELGILSPKKFVKKVEKAYPWII